MLGDEKEIISYMQKLKRGKYELVSEQENQLDIGKLI